MSNHTTSAPTSARTLDDVCQQVQAVVSRSTGSDLSAPACADIAAALRAWAEPAPAPFELDMQPREVTVLWAKLRGVVIEEVAASQNPDFSSLNRCLSRLIDVVLKFGGVIDQLSGDSIKVHFGAEQTRPDDVERAVMCAVEMQMVMRDLNLEHMGERIPQVFLGVGVSTGKAYVGRIGSAAYSRVTLIGDVVNRAQRLQAFSLRGQVLISEETYDRCWGIISATAPTQVYVKGSVQPIQLRELVAIPTKRLKVPRQEFRRSHRVEVRLPCHYQLVRDGVVLPHVANGIIRDMGYHGVMLELAEPLALQGDVRLSFDLPMVSYLARDIYARVVTIKADTDRPLVGVEFTSTSAEFESQVQRFVQMMVAGH